MLRVNVKRIYKTSLFFTKSIFAVLHDDTDDNVSDEDDGNDDKGDISIVKRLS